MTKGIFIQYLLLPLIALLFIAVMVWAKKKNDFIQNKKLVTYLLAVMLVLALPGFFGIMGNTFSPWGYLTCQIIYLAAGGWHVNLLRDYVTGDHTGPSEIYGAKQKRVYAIFFEILLTLFVMITGGYLFSVLFNWLSPYTGYGLIAATSMLSFIVPLIFLYTYQRFLEIPFAIYKVWQFAPQRSDGHLLPENIGTLMLINLELTKTISDGRRIRLKVKAPSNIQLGDWMGRVLEDHQEKNHLDRIDTFFGESGAYGWIFYIKPSFLHPRRYLDFEKTIIDNNIRERHVVVCKRVIDGNEEKLISLKSGN